MVVLIRVLIREEVELYQPKWPKMDLMWDDVQLQQSPQRVFETLLMMLLIEQDRNLENPKMGGGDLEESKMEGNWVIETDKQNSNLGLDQIGLGAN